MLFVQFGINSTRDVWKFCQKALAPRLVQFRQNFQTSFALLIPNCTRNRISRGNSIYHLFSRQHVSIQFSHKTLLVL